MKREYGGLHMSEKKSILVAGGAGFIGSHLCERLLSEGNKVICIDNLSSGCKDNIENIKSKDFKFIKKDIVELNPSEIKEKVDEIYHLASRASPVHFEKFPIHIMLTNSYGTKNLLDLAYEKGAVILFTSTSEVYGEPLEHPQRETYRGNVSTTGIRSCYDESKRFGEALLAAYSREKGLETRIARIFNTYGPRMDCGDGRVVPNFITQALTGKAITIYGNGEQTRSMCYVSDLVEGLYKLMNSSVKEPVNLGNPHEITILELANKIISLTKSNSKIEYHPLPKDDPTRRRPDISRAKEYLGWEPKVNLEEGLTHTIEYFSSKLKVKE